jgi:BlaI family penicillinase repressor
MIKKLPDTELEVMQALWACASPATRMDVEALLTTTHPMAPTTLLTLLSRLADKGFIEIQKEGRITHYIPLITQEDYLATQSRRFLDILCGGSISTFANALCNSGISKEDLEELRRILERDAI